MNSAVNLIGHFQQHCYLLDSPCSGQNPYVKLDAISISPLKSGEMTMANTAEVINTLLESMIISNDDTIMPLESDTLYDEKTPLLGTPISFSQILQNDGVQPAEKRKTPNLLWSEGEIIELIEKVYYSVQELKKNPKWRTRVNWNTIIHSTRCLKETKEKYYRLRQKVIAQPILDELAKKNISGENLIKVLKFKIPAPDMNGSKNSFKKWTIEEIAALITQLYKKVTGSGEIDCKNISIPNKTQTQITKKYYHLRSIGIMPQVVRKLARYNITKEHLKTLNITEISLVCNVDCEILL